ncbi:MAG: alanine racemase, partial [Myxococcales bacterium]
MAMRFPAEASWLEIDAKALAHNAAVFREVLGPGVRLGGVLKGNAYGHGFAEALPTAHACCDVLYVIEARDALAVRDFEARTAAPRRPVLVLGAVDAGEAVELARAGVDVAITDAGQARFIPALRAAGVRLRGHIHLDTGLGREGFMPEEIPAALGWIVPDAIEVAGVLSHFANTEDVTEQNYAAQQLAAFEEGARRVTRALGLSTVEKHIAASAAALLLPTAREDVVRMGISLYGLWPSSETRLSARALLGRVPELRPVLSWRCRSQLTKWLPAGSYVGYGCTYRCPSPTRIAILPLGYYDGYPRLLSSRAHALVAGQRCPVLGRVMMNHGVLDVSRAAPSDAPGTAPQLG